VLTCSAERAAPYGFVLHVSASARGSWRLLIALAFAVALALSLAIAWDFARIGSNGFGLCRGWSEEERMDSPDLSGIPSWVHPISRSRKPHR